MSRSADTAPTQEQARHDRQLGFIGLALDLAMVSLAVINLVWIVFDSAWAVTELRNMMGWVVPDAWLASYSVVHERFFRIDLIFVSIFISEFLMRWGEALWHRRYKHWMAYPILHWYDILGCIPVAGLRWLRVLRIFAILLRLQKLGLIDYTTWVPYAWGKRVYDVIMEEISDRVVVRVLSGVQDEIGASGNLEQQILEQVVQPRQQLIADALRDKLVSLGQRGYASARDDLHQFITSAVAQAVRENREIKIIDRIPMVGGVVGDLLNNAITDIVCRVLDELIGRLSSEEFEMLFNDISGAIMDGLIHASVEADDSDELMRAISDVLDVIKAQVSQRRWLEA